MNQYRDIGEDFADIIFGASPKPPVVSASANRIIKAGNTLARSKRGGVKRAKAASKAVKLGNKALSPNATWAKGGTAKAAVATKPAVTNVAPKVAPPALRISTAVPNLKNKTTLRGERDDEGGSEILLMQSLWPQALQSAANLLEAINATQDLVDRSAFVVADAPPPSPGTVSSTSDRGGGGYSDTPGSTGTDSNAEKNTKKPKKIMEMLGADATAAVQATIDIAIAVFDQLSETNLDLSIWSASAISGFISDMEAAQKRLQGWLTIAKAPALTQAAIDTSFTVSRSIISPETTATETRPIAQGITTPWTPNTRYPVGSQASNLGNLYQATTADGVSAPTGPGPNALSGIVKDGTVQWKALGTVAQAAAPLAPGPFDTGSSDGGGGGGGGSGGDPFADAEDQDQGDGGMPAAARDPFADMDQDSGESSDEGGDAPSGDDEMPTRESYDPLADSEEAVEGVSFAPYRGAFSAEQQARIDESNARLAAARAALAAQRATPGAPLATSQFQLSPSAGFAERFAEAQAALASGGAQSGDESFDPTQGDEAVQGDELVEAPMTVTEQQIADAFDSGAANLAANDIITDLFAGSGTEVGRLTVLKGDDLQCACDVFGAGTPPSRPKTRTVWKQKTTPAGNQILSQTPVKPKMGDHGKSIANAKDVAKRAVAVGQKLKTALAKGGMKPSVAVHGLPTGRVVSRTRKRLGPAQIKKLADLAIKGGQNLGKQADKHGNQVKTVSSNIVTGVKGLRNYVQTGGKTAIRGADEIAGLAWAEVLGAEAVTRSMLGADVSYSAFQPAGAASAPAADQGAPPSDMVTSEGAVDPATVLSDPNAGQGPIPTLESIGPPPFMPDPGYMTDKNAYSALPEGAIIYDASRLGGNEAFGAFNVYHGNGDGIWWNDAKKRWYGKWGDWKGDLSDWGARDDAGLFRDWPPNSIPRLPGDTNFKDVQKDVLLAGWGPLIGNPKSNDVKALRYDQVGDQFFWFYDGAPDWARAPGDQLRLQQAITDWETAVTAAKTDAAAQAAQDALDAEQAKQMQKQQLGEDAAMKRQQEQEQSKSQHEAGLQETADTQAAKRQQTVEEAEQRAAAAQGEIDRQAALTQAQIDREAAMSQAEIEDRRAAQGVSPGDTGDSEGGYGDSGGYAGGEDGSDQPGIMDTDQDGEQVVQGVAGLKRRLGIK